MESGCGPASSVQYALIVIHPVERSAWRWLNKSAIWFQLANVWLTIISEQFHDFRKRRGLERLWLRLGRGLRRFNVD
jgi:hypothetical protein